MPKSWKIVKKIRYLLIKSPELGSLVKISIIIVQNNILFFIYGSIVREIFEDKAVYAVLSLYYTGRLKSHLYFLELYL